MKESFLQFIYIMICCKNGKTGGSTGSVVIDSEVIKGQ